MGGIVCATGDVFGIGRKRAAIMLLCSCCEYVQAAARKSNELRRSGISGCVTTSQRFLHKLWKDVKQIRWRRLCSHDFTCDMWMSRNVEGEKVHGTWPGPQEQRIRVQLSEIQKVKRKPHFEKVKQCETMWNNVHFEYFYVFLCISGTFSARTSANFQISAVELNSLS